MAHDQPVNRFRVLRLLKQGDVTLTEATSLLNASRPTVVLKWQVVYGKHIAFLEKKVDELQAQHLLEADRTRLLREIAERLDVTPRRVNKILEADKIVTPRPYYAVLRDARAEQAKEKWLARTKAALAVISGSHNMESAADEAEVTSRQMYRWVTRLLSSEGLGIKDLRNMSTTQRATIADRIEAAELAQYGAA